jgi:hypothetical protein
LQHAFEKKMDFVDDKTIDHHHAKAYADTLAVGREPQTGLGQKTFLAFYQCHRTTW